MRADGQVTGGRSRVGKESRWGKGPPCLSRASESGDHQGRAPHCTNSQSLSSGGCTLSPTGLVFCDESMGRRGRFCEQVRLEIKDETWQRVWLRAGKQDPVLGWGTCMHGKLLGPWTLKTGLRGCRKDRTCGRGDESLRLGVLRPGMSSGTLGFDSEGFDGLQPERGWGMHTAQPHRRAPGGGGQGEGPVLVEPPGSSAYDAPSAVNTPSQAPSFPAVQFLLLLKGSNLVTYFSEAVASLLCRSSRRRPAPPTVVTVGGGAVRSSPAPGLCSNHPRASHIELLPHVVSQAAARASRGSRSLCCANVR